MLSSSVHFSYIFYVLSFFVTRIICRNDICSCDLPDSNFADGINLIYYKCNNETPATIAFPITEPQNLMNGRYKVINDTKRVIFYVFDYMQNPEDSNVELIMEALCHGRTDNVILLDWSKYSNGSYEIGFDNPKKIGSLFAQGIRMLVDSGLDVSKIYIIGHGFGAHISGFVGKCNDFVIPRITGLDPANPVLYPFGCYLKPVDAAWIDVIHTDSGVHGTPTFMGTSEFYANSGIRPQPGCDIITFSIGGVLCSHRRSVELYAMSKYDNNKFIAVMCPTFGEYVLNRCKNNLHTGIGYAASNVNGKFWFTAEEW